MRGSRDWTTAKAPWKLPSSALVARNFSAARNPITLPISRCIGGKRLWGIDPHIFGAALLLCLRRNRPRA